MVRLTRAQRQDRTRAAVLSAARFHGDGVIAVLGTGRLEAAEEAVRVTWSPWPW